MFGNQHGLELTLAVARDRDLDLRLVSLDPFARVAVAGMTALAPLGLMLRVAEQVGQLALERVLDEGFAEVLEEVLDVAGRPLAGQQLVEQLRID